LRTAMSAHSASRCTAERRLKPNSPAACAQRSDLHALSCSRGALERPYCRRVPRKRPSGGAGFSAQPVAAAGHWTTRISADRRLRSSTKRGCTLRPTYRFGPLFWMSNRDIQCTASPNILPGPSFHHGRREPKITCHHLFKRCSLSCCYDHGL
jgi:hypothetical protein